MKTKQIFLLGDFNINLLRYGSNTDVANLLHNMFSSTFIPLIFSLTRRTSSSNTLLDNIFANSYDPNFNARNLVTTISDHLGQFLKCLSKIKKLKTATAKKLLSDFGDYNNIHIHEMST